MSMSAIFADLIDTPHLLGLIERSATTPAAA
jgi:hypothetical protein